MTCVKRAAVAALATLAAVPVVVLAGGVQARAASPATQAEGEAPYPVYCITVQPAGRPLPPVCVPKPI